MLLVAAFGAFLAFLDSTIVNIAFPNIQKSFPTYAISSLSWVLNAYNIVFAAFLVAAGKLADLLGRKRMFVCGVVLFTIASGLCAVAGTVEQLVAFRVLQGVGPALLVPASLALVVEGRCGGHRVGSGAALRWSRYRSVSVATRNLPRNLNQPSSFPVRHAFRGSVKRSRAR